MNILAINEMIDLIEKDLKTELSSKTIIENLDVSYSHLQKAFYYLSGITISEYIRKRRLTLAAFDLQQTDETVLNIALKYGYESPTAFNRAFQAIHGMTPKEARLKQKEFLAFPKMQLNISIKGSQPISYKIIEKEEFQIIGYKISTSLNHDYQNEIINLWKEKTKEGLLNTLAPLMNNEPLGLLGVSNGNYGYNNDFDYYIAIASNESIEGYDTLKIPASKWAIFDFSGAVPKSVHDMQKRILEEWYIQSGYQYSNLPEIEVYKGPNIYDEDYEMEIWIPLQ